MSTWRIRSSGRSRLTLAISSKEVEVVDVRAVDYRVSDCDDKSVVRVSIMGGGGIDKLLRLQ